MTQLLFFLHLGGYALWIGGALAQMMVSIASRRMTRSELGTMARLQAAIAQNVVAPGAGATVLSGLILTFRSFPGAAGEMAAPSIWLMVMQLAGLLAGVLTLAVAVPGAFRVARIDPAGPVRRGLRCTPGPAEGRGDAERAAGGGGAGGRGDAEGEVSGKR